MVNKKAVGNYPGLAQFMVKKGFLGWSVYSYLLYFRGIYFQDVLY